MSRTILLLGTVSLIVSAMGAGCGSGTPAAPTTPTTPKASPPALTSISLASGPVSGGTAVTITGTGFASGATVTFGGAAASGVSVVSAASITATTPAHAEGAVDVVVRNADGQSGQLTNGFTYQAASRVKLGLWQGTIPPGPSGAGTFSFRVTSPTSLTFIATKVPTFNNLSGCSSTWNVAVAVDATGAFTANLTSGNTSLTYAGKFDSDILATGSVSGVCSGGLVLLGMTFRAAWASD
jgi:hypothetical protein